MNELITQLRLFRKARKWEKYHDERSLAMSIAIEAAELMECYQWPGLSNTDNVKDEVADVFIYLLNFCDVSGIDLIEVTKSKIKKNAEKYPVSIPGPEKE